MLPNLECEVEINEDPDSIPQPMSIKDEKINDIKTNSIEGAKQSLLVKDEKDLSPISSPSKEKDKLACDLAEFETDVIGEQLGDESGDIDTCIIEDENSAFKIQQTHQSVQELSSDPDPPIENLQTLSEENESSENSANKEDRPAQVGFPNRVYIK